MKIKKQKILITGSAGFIGFSLARSFLKSGYEIIGIDNINNYYSVKLKNDRLSILKKFKKFKFYKIDIRNKKKLLTFLKKKKNRYNLSSSSPSRC